MGRINNNAKHKFNYTKRHTYNKTQGTAVCRDKSAVRRCLVTFSCACIFIDAYTNSLQPAALGSGSGGLCLTTSCPTSPPNRTCCAAYTTRGRRRSSRPSSTLSCARRSAAAAARAHDRGLGRERRAARAVAVATRRADGTQTAHGGWRVEGEGWCAGDHLPSGGVHAHRAPARKCKVQGAARAAVSLGMLSGVY